jgi:hypothetical protein
MKEIQIWNKITTSRHSIAQSMSDQNLATGVARLFLNATVPSQVSQIFEDIFLRGQVFYGYLRELKILLYGVDRSLPELPTQAVIWLQQRSELIFAIGHSAEMFAKKSPHNESKNLPKGNVQGELVHNDSNPSPELNSPITAHSKSQLAFMLIVYLAIYCSQTPGVVFIELARIAYENERMQAASLASSGYELGWITPTELGVNVEDIYAETRPADDNEHKKITSGGGQVLGLHSLLIAPAIVPRAAQRTPGKPSSGDGEEEVAQRSRVLLMHRAKPVAEPFFSAASRNDLEGILAEALDDNDLLAKLAAFDDVADTLVKEIGSQPSDREALVLLVGESIADRIVSPTPLDQAVQKALDQLKAEGLVGKQRPGLALFRLSPEETAQLPGRLMQLLLDHWKSKLAAATLVAALLGNKTVRGWRADALYETLVQGKQATLVLLASMGLGVPEALAPARDRVDLEAILQRDQRLQERLANAFSFDPSEPDASVIFPPSIA